MIKRLVVLCCILLLPTIAAAQATNPGDFWVGGELGVVFNANRDVDLQFQNQFFNVRGRLQNLRTDPGFSAGGIVGYNFCLPYKQVWERYFGVALDFQWNQFNQPRQGFLPRVPGKEFALAFLGRLQYPLMGSETFTRGRIVPFLMAGPAIVWTNSSFANFGGRSVTSTDFGVVAEVGAEFFIIPQLSIGPSFRYRHVFGPNYEVFRGLDIKSNLNQFMLLGRLAYHF